MWDQERSGRNADILEVTLDSESDIRRRKGIASDVAKKIKYITRDERLDTDIKMRAFNAYATSISLYNGETWTVSKGTSDAIDSYHLRILGNVIEVRWPMKISSLELYEKTKQ